MKPQNCHCLKCLTIFSLSGTEFLKGKVEGKILGSGEQLQCWRPQIILAEVESHTLRNICVFSPPLSTGPSERKNPQLQILISATQISGNVSLGFSLSNSSAARREITEDRSQQRETFRAIPGCRTFDRDLCRPCRLGKS